MDSITKGVHALEHRLKLFAEFNPNPIILLNLLGEIIYINLAARTQFPTITAVGIHHPVLSVLVQELKKNKPDGKVFTIFSQDVTYFANTYEQQIFLIPDNDTIFVYMYDVTEKNRFEAVINDILYYWVDHNR